MSAVEQQLAPGSVPPIDPRVLVDVPPLERGRAYNEADLDHRQRAAVEEAIRMVRAGTYPSGGAR
jgi:hypothetical protein